MAFTGCAHDKSAGDARAIGLQNTLQSAALVVAGDLAGYADVVHGGHVNQEPSRQGNMRSNARPLLAQRLLRDLYDDFLSFFEQVGDGRRGPLRSSISSWGGMGFGRRSGGRFRHSGLMLRSAAGLRQSGTVLPAHAPGNAVKVTRTLFAQGSSQASWNSCGLGPFFCGRLLG